jgi:hypothetical protein
MKAALPIAALLLAGCSSAKPQCHVPDLVAFPQPNDIGRMMEGASTCVAHWSAAYAQVDEPAGDVADAAVAQCSTYFENLAALSQKPGSVVAATPENAWRGTYRNGALVNVFDYRRAGCPIDRGFL